MFILKTLLRIVIALIIVSAIGIGVLGRERMLEIVFGSVTYSPIEFKTLERSPRPNQYLVCPPDFCTAKADATSPVYDVTQDVLKKAWLTLMAEQPHLTQLSMSPDASQYDFMQRTEWVRFPDTITVKFIALSTTDQSTLAIYSRSHYGYSDWGVNRERIEGWLKSLDRHLANQTG
ncbi:MAG: hypothetical protein ETSY2_11490 [Candidatus Entotheonella gemina]|uniref:DUF1499 domain-containing protein n=1 Tax=Candidatus Entotheonella gemina TaxID=1429439 RepID=W4MBW2_9BACT|nr:MAG: hypothetical protein ETSY2_11490 [Candidatus Entotheonella gemina]